MSKIENGNTYNYQYDKRGNLTGELYNDKLIKEYTYDATNHMVLGRNTENGEKTEYTYNGLYMRIKNIQTLEQVSNSYQSYIDNTGVENKVETFKVKEINYVIDYLSDTNNELLSEEKGYGTTRVTYGLGSERLNQKITIYPETPKTIRTEIAKENNGKTYFQSDILGSVLFASNQEGEIIRYAERDAWGNLKIPVQGDINFAGIENSLGFTNYNYDQVIDKYFAQARFYDSTHGRMLSEDLIKDGRNWYIYCANNPINNIDPTGNKKKPVTFERWFNKKYKKIKNYKYGPTQVKLKNNEVTVEIRVNFGYTNKKIVKKLKEGIERRWSGTVKISGYKVSVKTIVIKNITNITSHYITYNKGAGVSYAEFGLRSGEWSSSVAHSTTIYSCFSDGEKRKKSDIWDTVAHEFGHILGIEDAYKYKPNLQYAPKNDIMRWYNGRKTKMSKYDVLMFLKAFSENEYQRWSQFGMEYK